ncbi:MAG: 3-hydroxyacyl-[acyl-carrier-protein] dehydratase FabZ [Candidatus Meridianibacter frigidus]|nr:MAG: 3-hydroxyacyl-[acyl-carrier-protein] dehydratase FabZ [Candidatus Eremiobacteraeota bacterium]
MAQLDIRQIMEILPHRYPILLIDRIIELEPGKRAVGYKNITNNEPVFNGHFPGNPLFPGVYMIEALAQLGGATVLEPGEISRKTPYLAALDKVKFRRPVIPGDCLMMETKVLKVRKNIGWISAVAKVDGQLVCSGELMFSIASDPRLFGYDAAVLHA